MNISGVSSTSLIDNPDLDSSSPPLRSLSRSGSFESLHSNALIICEPDEWDAASAVITESYTPPTLAITNEKASFGIKPSNYSIFGTKENYLTGYLLNIGNSKGKPPLLLRPLAALLAYFGIHGFGQTNCASCATAVAETFEKNTVYLARPELRGGDVKGNMGLLDKSAKSVDELLTQLQQYQPTDELNGVLVIHRPAMLRMLPGATQGHACNVIKFKDSNILHFIDVQKKTHLSCDLSLSQQVKPLNLIDQTKLSHQDAQISKFLGWVGADGIDLYKKEFHADINKKAGASSAPA
ncbi:MULTISPECIES: hypothetical protein [Yersinia]|uniref:hypothetical protein n=1 Tax=Yersinia TaxID=629 RepID=UPI00119D9970|nr:MULTISPECIES: hypothetical protein [Yersinia]MDA5545328.1 hypothetical protein [Yersinia rochesterensis]MDR5018999.1 hypothetical protein [Yersinia rochesterensis]UZM75003.1 hypothetical protein OP863_19280 [Yersinia sp. SCPM-O-B-9106 (C-191)]